MAVNILPTYSKSEVVKAPKMVKGLEAKSYEEQCEELSLEKGRLKGNVIAVFSYLKGCQAEAGPTASG